MYIKIIILFFILTNPLLSEDYISEALGDFVRKEIILNKKTFSIFETNFKWKDTDGQFGEGYCIGHMKKIDDKLDLYNLCESTDSEGEKFWMEGIRKSGEARGVGTLTYIKTTGKYNKFLNKKCNYGVSWYNESSFYLKQKCKF